MKPEGGIRRGSWGGQRQGTQKKTTTLFHAKECGTLGGREVATRGENSGDQGSQSDLVWRGVAARKRSKRIVTTRVPEKKTSSAKAQLEKEESEAQIFQGVRVAISDAQGTTDAGRARPNPSKKTTAQGSNLRPTKKKAGGSTKDISWAHLQ